MSPSGWITTVIGKSNNAGINVIEYPNYDATLGIDQEPFNLAVGISNSRGNWVRTGGNTFDYTFTGFALDEANNPVYISKISGQVTIYGDCQFQYITAFLDAFLPDQNPFTDVPINTEPIPLGVFYGYRASVDLPFWLSIKTTRLAPASAGAFSRASGGQRVVHVPGKTAVKGATGFHDGARRAI